MATSRLCSIPNCDKPVCGHGWCNAHYKRWLRHGDPLKGRRAPAGHGEPMRYIREVVMAYDGDECLTWPYGKHSKGYAQIGSHLASRIVCEEENGPPPTPEHHAAHSCGKGHEACVTKGHLSWKTPKENGDDKLVHGTSPRGAKNVFAKLTETQVTEIRALNGVATHRQIAASFGVTRCCVSKILSGQTWGWLE